MSLRLEHLSTRHLYAFQPHSCSCFLKTTWYKLQRNPEQSFIPASSMDSEHYFGHPNHLQGIMGLTAKAILHSENDFLLESGHNCVERDLLIYFFGNSRGSERTGDGVCHSPSKQRGAVLKWTSAPEAIKRGVPLPHQVQSPNFSDQTPLHLPRVLNLLLAPTSIRPLYFKAPEETADRLFVMCSLALSHTFLPVATSHVQNLYLTLLDSNLNHPSPFTHLHTP